MIFSLCCCTYLNCKVISMQMYTVLGTHASKTAIISTDKLGYFSYHQDLAFTMPALGYWKYTRFTRSLTLVKTS